MPKLHAELIIGVRPALLVRRRPDAPARRQHRASSTASARSSPNLGGKTSRYIASHRPRLENASLMVDGET